VKILLDENTPVQLVEPLRLVLGPDHEVAHVNTLNWKSKKDRHLIPDAAKLGYEVLVTYDSNQLRDPEECKLIKRTGIHHVRFKQGQGRKGLGRAMGAVLAALPVVIDELELAKGQRLIHIHDLAASTKRHTSVDPAKSPPPYWP
jgi:hypothetical protein